MAGDAPGLQERLHGLFKRLIRGLGQGGAGDQRK
jgi:hypothetical protein